MELAKIAAVLLGLAALGGITLAAMRLNGTPKLPTWLAVIHGLVATSGLGTLIYVLLTQEVSSEMKIAAGILIAAALGGSTMFFGFQLRGRQLPIVLVLGHGFIAAAGLVLLLKAVFVT